MAAPSGMGTRAEWLEWFGIAEGGVLLSVPGRSLSAAGGAAGWARLRLLLSAGLAPSRPAAASLSHGAPRPPVPVFGFPDAWGYHSRTAGPEGSQQPALDYYLHFPPHCSSGVLSSLHPTEGKAECRTGGEDWSFTVLCPTEGTPGIRAYPEFQTP